jgi:hypothetical protein
VEEELLAEVALVKAVKMRQDKLRKLADLVSVAVLEVTLIRTTQVVAEEELVGLVQAVALMAVMVGLEQLTL